MIDDGWWGGGGGKRLRIYAGHSVIMHTLMMMLLSVNNIQYIAYTSILDEVQ